MLELKKGDLLPAKTGKELRAELIVRLEAEGRLDLAQTLSTCGRKIVMRATCCGDGKVGKTRCKNKWCPTCSRSIAAERSAKLEQLLPSMRWPLFATFTMANVHDLHTDAVRELRRAFGRWRRMKIARLIRGGVASIEVTNIGNGWHPHLHAVVDCKWLGDPRMRPHAWESKPEKEEAYRQNKILLETSWAKALRHPRAQVHVKRAEKQNILREVVKYSVKGEELTQCQEKIGPLIDCLKLTRLMTTFGFAHGFKFKQKEKLKSSCSCGGCLDGWGWLPQEIWQGWAEGTEIGRANSDGVKFKLSVEEIEARVV